MKKILGLDLGSTSIGWAYIEEGETSKKILGLGVRIINYTGDELDQFGKGQAISVNKERTLKRTARKTNYRYKLRRRRLEETLYPNQMLPSHDLMTKVSPKQLFEWRAKAVTERLDLTLIGRVLLHLNQKRGYRSSRFSTEDQESGKKLSDYLQELQDRKSLLETDGKTIGQYFYENYLGDPAYQIRRKVFPRECYLQEFDYIWNQQQKHYPTILTEELRKTIRDKIIFFQRPLKSQKHLVGECRFEKHHKVTPRSSPLFQVCKVWESVNNISLSNKRNEIHPISQEQKAAIFQFLQEKEKMTHSELLKILGLKRTDGWTANEQIRKAGIQGNITRCQILKTLRSLDLSDRNDLLQFNLTEIQKDQTDKETGEIKSLNIISEDFEQQPLYKLWHAIYSIEDHSNLEQTLYKQFLLTEDQAKAFSKLDFKTAGFGNKSARAMRKLIPSLSVGLGYAEACKKAGWVHSDSMTVEDRQNIVLAEELPLYPRNSLRQPVVEKVMNQLVHLINCLVKDSNYGRPDEIRVELARDLKQSREERNKAYSRTIATDKRHKEIVARLNNEYPELTVTKKVIEKYKLHEEQNGLCLYSGKSIPLAMALKGETVDIDHIIPQTRLFDDSFQNKVLAYQDENRHKSNSTAFDYMNSKSHDEFEKYLERVEQLYSEDRITRSKRFKLLMKESEIPDDFITRQMNETRYISRESTRLLQSAAHKVSSSTGIVTSFLRNEWGYNKILGGLRDRRLQVRGMENAERTSWGKRDDHRHHALDALVVACTSQSIIQRLNTLNSRQTREQLLESINGKSEEGWQGRRPLYEQYIYTIQPFTTQEVSEALAQILISRKPGKRLATWNRNPHSSKKSLTPRGQLHKEQVYGKIKRYSAQKTRLNGRFNQVDDIANKNDQRLVIERLAKFGGNPKKAFEKLDKDPIWRDAEQTIALTEVTLWEYEHVYRYTLDPSFKEKDIDSIIDPKVREKVRERFDSRFESKEHPLKNITHDPIWLNKAKRIPITSVRCRTGLNELPSLHKAVAGLTGPAITKNAFGIPVDFVNPRNNHHIAIYENTSGELEEIQVTLWEGVKRKKLGLPPIVKDPLACWDYVQKKNIDDQTLLGNLPQPEWQFIQSLQLNEYFVFQIEKHMLIEIIGRKAWSEITDNLYRLQSISSSDYFFRHHIETKLEPSPGIQKQSMAEGKMIRIKSLSKFRQLNPIKVRVSNTGQIELGTS